MKMCYNGFTVKEADMKINLIVEIPEGISEDMAIELLKDILSEEDIPVVEIFTTR